MNFDSKTYPIITVTLPVLNSVSTIEKALLSVVDQNYPNLELMVMDGGSTDGTLEIIQKYKQHISHFRSRKDEGNAEAQNEARELCKGDIISLLCADDYFEPSTLIRVGQAFIENPEAEIVNVLGRMTSTDKAENIIYGDVSKAEDMPISMGHVKVLHPNCRFIRKELFTKYGKIIGTVNGEMTIASDYEYITRFSLYNPKNITLNFIGYNYLVNEKSLTFNSNKYTKLCISDQNVFYIDELLKNYSHLMDEDCRNDLLKKYKTAFERRIVKNIIDKKFQEACRNMGIGVSRFGVFYIFNVVRSLFSYKVRLNKKVRKLKRKLDII